jgi:hypothetical protein
MEKFIVVLTEKAKQDISLHKRSGNKAIERKIKSFLEELKVHPFS